MTKVSWSSSQTFIDLNLTHFDKYYEAYVNTFSIGQKSPQIFESKLKVKYIFKANNHLVLNLQI